tara:strand:- start:1066 stop:1368 length:303 start_codon:yes stop_codon:yes gene_type:complete
MQHSMPTMQELVNYQLDEPSLSEKLAADMEETDRQIEAANVFQEKLDNIDNLVRRYATWDSIFQDILDAEGEPNKNGITLDDCFDMKSDIMDKIKRLVTN